MKVKRYGYHRVNKWGFDYEIRFDGDDLDAKYVLATDYDALLALAMRLRDALDVHSRACGCETCDLRRESDWLEEA